MKKILFIASITLLCSCDKEDDKSPAPSTPTTSTPVTSIGASYGGGIVCYVNATGDHGFIAAPFDQDTASVWDLGTHNQIFTSMTEDHESLGTGAGNTATIVAFYGPGDYAAYLCDTLTLNGYTDWFLPSKHEMYSVWANLYSSTGLPGEYSTSTEGGTDNIWTIGASGTMSAGGLSKSQPLRIRAIRAF